MSLSKLHAATAVRPKQAPPPDPARRAATPALRPRCACGGGCPRCTLNVNADGPAGSYLPGEGTASTDPLPAYGPGLPATEPDMPLTTAPATPAAPPRLPILSGLQREVQVKRGGPALSAEAFGLTGSELSWHDLRVEPAPLIDAFMIHGIIRHKVMWDVWEPTGPQSQTDIGGADDADITSTNFPDVVRDLRPDASGRARRTQFYAADLTRRHELFHVIRHRLIYKQELDAGNAWLNGKTVGTAWEAQQLALRMLERVDLAARSRTGNGQTVDSSEENLAYAADKPRYKQRAADIAAKGKAGGYP